MAGLEVHHAIPVRDGGSNDFDNLLLLCACCHRIAHHLHRKMNYPVRTKGDVLKILAGVDRNRAKFQEAVEGLET